MMSSGSSQTTYTQAQIFEFQKNLKRGASRDAVSMTEAMSALGQLYASGQVRVVNGKPCVGAGNGPSVYEMLGQAHVAGIDLQL